MNGQAQRDTMAELSSAELLAEIRAALAHGLHQEARFRERVADEWPEDRRNERSARALRDLADELRTNDVYDDTPALRKLLGLVTAHGIDLDLLMPGTDTGFDASRFRFGNPIETDDEFLSRLADAVESEYEELEVVR